MATVIGRRSNRSARIGGVVIVVRGCDGMIGGIPHALLLLIPRKNLVGGHRRRRRRRPNRWIPAHRRIIGVSIAVRCNSTVGIRTFPLHRGWKGRCCCSSRMMMIHRRGSNGGHENTSICPSRTGTRHGASIGIQIPSGVMKGGGGGIHPATIGVSIRERMALLSIVSNTPHHTPKDPPKTTIDE